MGIMINKINLFFENLPDQLRAKRIWVGLFFIFATAFLAMGMKNVVIDESLAAYFHKDDPVKQAYDKFRSIFGGDEYVYIVYKARDKDIFSDSSLTALKNLHHALADYRLGLADNEKSPLDHMEEVKSLINVKYMEAHDNTLYSRSFIGDRLPGTQNTGEGLGEKYRQKALNHPDYPLIYLSRNSQYGGIVIRTDFNAKKKRNGTAYTAEGQEPVPDGGSIFDTDDPMFSDGSIFSDNSLSQKNAVPRRSDFSKVEELEQTDIREYPKFMKALRTVLSGPAYTNVLEFYPVGNPVLMDFFTSAVIQDMGRLMSLVLLLIVIMLWLLFRSFSAVVWPVLIVLCTIVWVLGLVGWLNTPMSAMLQVIIFLSLSVGIADSVHILSGYLFFRNNNLTHDQALGAVMKKSGLACLLTSLTTAVGLLSLTLVPLKPIAQFGLFAAIAVLFAFVLTIFLMPPLLDLWAPVSKNRIEKKDHFIQNLLIKVEGIGINRPRTVITIFTLAGFLLFYGLLQLKIDSNFVEIIKKGLPLRDAYILVDEHMGGTGNMEVMVDFNQADALKDPRVLFAMEALQKFMENDKTNRVVKTYSLVNVVKESFKALNNDDPKKYIIPKDSQVLSQVLFMFENANPGDRARLVSDNYSQARIKLNSINVGSIEALEILETIQSFIDKQFDPLTQSYPDLEVTLTGNMALLAIMLDYIAWAQIKSFGLALVVISLILLMVLGSWKAGLVALAPNLFPILTTFGLMGYFKIPLDADTLLIAPIIIGLAVDDTIHFMTHFRIEMERTKSIARAAITSIREAGQAIAFTSIILSAGFLVFLLSFHNGLSNFGIFAAIAVLTALISDLFLLPALIRVINLNFGQRSFQ
ncbi:MAG: MMPL family transporter [Desulfobacteraceae bacterium]|nr:MMPL family transporter [Desulfobacteraceae bacterium]